MTPKQRKIIYDKYNGLCAYTGKPLDDTWQVDHIFPLCSNAPDLNDIGNLVPTFAIINHYKRSLDLAGFRKYMLKFHERIAKLPKKTLVPRTEKRKQYMLKVAELFDITPDKPFSGTFYFETIQP
jgi:5-methylcytosine-specific restriction endonuclease McrA